MFSQTPSKRWEKRRQAQAASLGFGGHHSQMTCWNLATALGYLKVCILGGDVCSWPHGAEFSAGAEVPELCFPLCQRSWKPAATQRTNLIPHHFETAWKRLSEGACIHGKHTLCKGSPLLQHCSWEEALTGCSLREEEAAGI